MGFFQCIVQTLEDFELFSPIEASSIWERRHNTTTYIPYVRLPASG